MYIFKDFGRFKVEVDDSKDMGLGYMPRIKNKKSLLQKYPFKKLTIDGKRARKVERYIERKKEVLRKINR